jgi:hypothetical protein
VKAPPTAPARGCDDDARATRDARRRIDSVDGDDIVARCGDIARIATRAMNCRGAPREGWCLERRVEARRRRVAASDDARARAWSFGAE